MDVNISWTHLMDDALIDAYLHQHIIGNRVGGSVTTHAMNNMNGMSSFAWEPITEMWKAEPEVWEKLIENEVTLENFNLFEDDSQDKESHEVSRSQAQSEAPKAGRSLAQSKSQSSKKAKSSRVDAELLFFKAGLDNVANAIMQSTSMVANAFFQSSNDMVILLCNQPLSS
ncbi:hypothetical protein GH714_000188 [Hevea brasiliensis]|uniref:Myb/SANT-like domain-containing protein n=1 Tax=Hevea brasiliensis TaxID=3981 RepID=A0A6A6M9B0_HEVBR|nr:hypothetical protein GH714_000188 [Hevea brasiliensis]